MACQIMSAPLPTASGSQDFKVNHMGKDKIEKVTSAGVHMRCLTQAHHSGAASSGPWEVAVLSLALQRLVTRQR